MQGDTLTENEDQIGDHTSVALLTRIHVVLCDRLLQDCGMPQSEGTGTLHRGVSWSYHFQLLKYLGPMQ
jgi:hypothetical protein